MDHCVRCIDFNEEFKIVITSDQTPVVIVCARNLNYRFYLHFAIFFIRDNVTREPGDTSLSERQRKCVCSKWMVRTFSKRYLGTIFLFIMSADFSVLIRARLLGNKVIDLRKVGTLAVRNAKREKSPLLPIVPTYVWSCVKNNLSSPPEKHLIVSDFLVKRTWRSCHGTGLAGNLRNDHWSMPQLAS